MATFKFRNFQLPVFYTFLICIFMKFTKIFSIKVTQTAVQVTVYSKSLNFKHIFSKNKIMNYFTILILSVLVSQISAGGSTFSSAPSPPTSSTAPKCVTCEEVLRNAVPPSPANCDPGDNELVTISIGYTIESGRPDASGACAGPHTGMKLFEWNSLIEHIRASHLIFP